MAYMTEGKIIGDISHSIMRVLKIIEKKEPYLLNKLVTMPHDKKFVTAFAMKIYGIYNRDTMMETWFDDFENEIVKEEYKEAFDSTYKFFSNKLKRAHDIVYANKKNLIIKESSVWVQVELKGGLVPNQVTKRMYLNIKPGYIDIVVKQLVDMMINGIWKTKPSLIFKFPNYKTMSKSELIRSEKVVVYYSKKWPDHEIFRDWTGGIQKYFRKNEPLFTAREGPGVAFACEPHEVMQEYHKKHMMGRGASFGSFISLIIAQVLYNWCLIHKKIPKGTEIGPIAKEVYHFYLRGRFNVKWDYLHH